MNTLNAHVEHLALARNKDMFDVETEGSEKLEIVGIDPPCSVLPLTYTTGQPPAITILYMYYIVVLGMQLRHSVPPACAVYIEDSEGWWLFVQLSYNGRILVLKPGILS